MSEIQLTLEQKAVIEAPCGEILVSAAAGSGKTFTMTRRIVGRILAHETSIDRCLILTFTENAADNMRTKIAEALHNAASHAAADERTYLLEQELRLEKAQISTIHAFCLNVFKRHGYLLAKLRDDTLLPDPKSAVADDDTREQLLLDAASEILEARNSEADELYLNWLAEGTETGEPYEPIWRLSDLYGDGKGDGSLIELMVEIYTFLRNMPDYSSWVEWALGQYHADCACFEKSRACRYYKERLAELLHIAAPDIHACREWLSDETLEFKKSKSKKDLETIAYNRRCVAQFRDALDQLEKLSGELPELSWEQIHETAAEFSFPPLDARGKNEAKLALNQLFRRSLAEPLELLTGNYGSQTYRKYFRFETQAFFVQTAESIGEKLGRIEPQLCLLFALILEMDRRYTEKKRGRNLLDYADMEHLAYQLVRLPEVAAYYRRTLDEIYIDEYQDTSSLQDAIVRVLGEDRLFMVGDIKQSIYRFRHANPQLFLDKYNKLRQNIFMAKEVGVSNSDAAGAGAEDKTRGRLYELMTNFRSEPGILRTVNEIFSAQLTERSGQIDYAEGQKLGIPAGKRGNEASPFRFLIYSDAREKLDAETVARLEQRSGKRPLSAEAAAIAEEIVCLIKAGAASEDIAVLARNNSELESVADALQACGYGLRFDRDKRRGDSLMLRVTMALCHLLDNPCQDQALVSCLRYIEVWGGFDTRDLLDIKARSLLLPDPLPLSAPFWQAYRACLESDAEDALIRRLKLFNEEYQALRRRAETLSLSELLGLLFDELRFKEQAAAGHNGKNAPLQLDAFAAWAERFDRPGEPGLAALCRRLDELDDTPDIVCAAPGDHEGQIQLMSFHKSKGLEFPYVFICGAGKKAGGRSESTRLSCSESLGIGPLLPGNPGEAAEISILRHHLNDVDRELDYAETMRLLYVALTRASRRVYLLAPGPALRDALGRLSEDASPDIGSAYKVHGALRQSLLAFILQGLAFQSGFPFGALLEAAGRAAAECERAAATWREQLSWSGAQNAGEEVLWEDCRWQFREMSPAIFGAQRHKLLAERTDTRAETFANPPHVQERVGALERLETLIQRQSDADTQAPSLTLSYPYLPATRSGLKYSVSELKKQAWLMPDGAENMDGMSEGLTVFLPTDRLEILLRQETIARRESDRPKDMSRLLKPLLQKDVAPDKQVLSSAEEGTLLHKAFRYLRPKDYRGLSATQQDTQFQATLSAWRESGLIIALEAETLTRRQSECLAFLNSEIAAEIARCDEGGEHTRIYREIPFTMALGANDIFSEDGFAPDDKVLVQGVIDLWYEIENKITLLDYKSDDLSFARMGMEDISGDARLLSILRDRYQKQLDLYALAIERETGVEVSRKIIWLSRARQAFFL